MKRGQDHAAASAVGAKSAGGASSKAAKEADKLSASLDREAERWRDLLDPLTRYKRDLSDLAKLNGILSRDEMAEAQRRLNIEFADSLPLAGKFVDTMTEGFFNGFSGTLSSLTGMFKSWLANMIAMAWKNRIVVGMGVSGGAGMAGAASAGVPGIGGAGGVLGNVMGGAAAFGGSLMTGASAAINGFLGGGLTGAMQAVQVNAAFATGTLGSLGTTLGAIALPVAAVAAAFSFFRKKTKELDAGMRVTVDGLDALVQTFRTVETKRFWGLSKKVTTDYSAADRETQDALSRIVGNLQTGVMSAAKVLGYGADTFAAFSHVMQVSTKDMSEEDALKAVQDAISGLGDKFAGMVPGLKRLTKDGEGASDALLRLSQSLIGVNSIMDTLGHKFRASGLTGAGTASQIADAFGGLDAMASATQNFYETFYSEAERLRTTTRQTRAALNGLGIAMPKTRDEFRAIIASLDLTTEKGRTSYAALIGLSDAMDLILPSASSLTKQMEKLQDKVVSAIGLVIGSLNDAIKINSAAAADWRKAGDGIREYLERLRGTASALFDPAQAMRYNRALYQRTLTAANRGDFEAAGNLPGAAQTYLSSVMDTAKTRSEAALAQARVAAALGKVAVKTDTTASALEKVAALQQRQVDILTRAQENIANGNALTKEGITSLLGKLGGLDERIAKQAGDAGVIVAGFDGALKATKMTAQLTGAEALGQHMDTLRGALGDLRSAIAAETKRQKEAVKNATEATKPEPSKPAVTRPTTPAKPKGYSLADYGLTTNTIGGSNGMGDRTRVTGPLGGTKLFTASLGGSRNQATAWLKAQNYPAFANGGTHRGGPAYVGENDLELVAPSRIYSPSETREMLDNREIVAELKAMRAEMAELRAHARRTADSAVQTEKTLKRVDAVGVKIDPDQNKVTA